METKTSKITRTIFTSEWLSPQGNQVYYHEIELSNGDKGQIGSKEKMPSKLNPGSELSYTIESTTRGNKIKAMVPPTQGFKGSQRPPVDPRIQFISFSYSYIKDLIVAGKLEITDLDHGAERMFHNMTRLLNTIK